MAKKESNKVEVLDKNPFKTAYNELNENNKSILRLNFLAAFEYKVVDTFYKKLNQETPLKNFEKEWLAKNMGIAILELFPITEEN